MRLKPDLHIMSYLLRVCTGRRAVFSGYCSATCNYAGHCRRVSLFWEHKSHILFDAINVSPPVQSTGSFHQSSPVIVDCPPPHLSLLSILSHCTMQDRMILYSDSMGSVPATHYHKYYSNYWKGCKLTQFYGYHQTTEGGKHYSEGWFNLPYFLSSQETGFEMAMLKHFDVELLIGQLSYKLKTNIYNLSHGYDTTKHLQCQYVYYLQSRYIKCFFALCSGRNQSINRWTDGDLKLFTSSMLFYNWQFVTQRPSVKKVWW